MERSRLQVGVLTRHAVIVGGGLAGLATALRLRKSGWRVTLFEAGPTFGGKMNRFSRQGFTFDTGPSLITMPWVFRDTFAAAGGKLEEHVDLRPLHPIAEYRFDDGTRFEYTSHIPAWLDTLKRIAPAPDAARFFDFLNLGARLFEVSRHTFFHRSPFERPDAGGRRALRHMPLSPGWGNYQRTIDSFFQSPYLRQLYGRYPTYVGSSPYRSPATLAVIPYIEFAFGGYSVPGGLYRIVEGLVALAREAVVELCPNSPVVEILTARGIAQGVRLASGEQVAADAVVMNGDSAALAQLLGQPKTPLRNRSMSGVVFLFGIDKDLPGVHQHTVLFSADYRREFSRIFDDQTFPDDPTVYVNVPSRGDRSLVPGSGGETLFIMTNAPATGQTWNVARERVFARLRKAGFPEFERDIVVSDVWTPQRIESRYLMPGGSIYGNDSHGWRNAFLRPRNQHATVRGLYHVGGSTHPGGGTPTVLMSAAITARLIEARHG